VPEKQFNYEYELIKHHYGQRTTERSGVLLMNHIDEGVAVLDALGASDHARRAFCLHPLFQADEKLAKLWQDYYALGEIDPHVLVLVMEYRNVANRGALHNLDYRNGPQLSPLIDVNKMLVADKVQNRKDFEKYHTDTHPDRVMLKVYFHRWLAALGISEEEYQKLAEVCEHVTSGG
jgi:hypothetical protein